MALTFSWQERPAPRLASAYRRQNFFRLARHTGLRGNPFPKRVSPGIFIAYAGNAQHLSAYWPWQLGNEICTCPRNVVIQPALQPAKTQLNWSFMINLTASGFA